MLYMICPTCGKLFADKQIQYEEKSSQISNDTKLTNKEKSKELCKLLDELGFTNYCCRIRILGCVDESKILVK